MSRHPLEHKVTGATAVGVTGDATVTLVQNTGKLPCLRFDVPAGSCVDDYAVAVAYRADWPAQTTLAEVRHEGASFVEMDASTG